MGSRVAAPPALAALIAAVALAGCGGATKTTTVVGAAGRASTGAGVARTSTAAGGEAVATVQRTPIAKASYEHWLAVTAVLSHSKAHSHAARAALEKRVLGFLFTAQWVLGEAAHLGIGANEAQVRQRLRQVTAKQYPTHRQL